MCRTEPVNNNCWTCSDTSLASLAGLCFLTFLACKFVAAYTGFTEYWCSSAAPGGAWLHCSCPLWHAPGGGEAAQHIRGVPAGGGGELWGVSPSNGHPKEGDQAFRENKVNMFCQNICRLQFLIERTIWGNLQKYNCWELIAVLSIGQKS